MLSWGLHQLRGPPVLTLDVGCGPNPTGDVNLDYGPTQQNTKNGVRTKANIYGDAIHLPFRSKAFDSVNCFHCLEHLRDPATAIRELERVGKTVHVKVPHRYCPGNNRNKSHLWSFTEAWFKRRGYKTTVSVTYRWFRLPLIPAWNEIDARYSSS